MLYPNLLDRWSINYGINTKILMNFRTQGFGMPFEYCLDQYFCKD